MMYGRIQQKTTLIKILCIFPANGQKWKAKKSTNKLIVRYAIVNQTMITYLNHRKIH